MTDSAAPAKPVPHGGRHFTVATFVVDGPAVVLLYHLKLRMWLPPGGHVEPDELPDEAAVREVLEETGLAVELVGELGVGVDRPRQLVSPAGIQLEDIGPGHQHIDLIYFARVTGGQARVAPQEAEAFHWYSHHELGGQEIAEDIRVLGREAIIAVMDACPPPARP